MIRPPFFLPHQRRDRGDLGCWAEGQREGVPNGFSIDGVVAPAGAALSSQQPELAWNGAAGGPPRSDAAAAVLQAAVEPLCSQPPAPESPITGRAPRALARRPTPRAAVSVWLLRRCNLMGSRVAAARWTPRRRPGTSLPHRHTPSPLDSGDAVDPGLRRRRWEAPAQSLLAPSPASSAGRYRAASTPTATSGHWEGNYKTRGIEVNWCGKIRQVMSSPMDVVFLLQRSPESSSNRRGITPCRQRVNPWSKLQVLRRWHPRPVLLPAIHRVGPIQHHGLFPSPPPGACLLQQQLPLEIRCRNSWLG